MLEGLNNITEKIKLIRSNYQQFNNFKPEVVKEFEQMYNDSISQKSGSLKKSSESNEILSVHPFLKKEAVNENIKISDDSSIKNQKEKINDAISKAGEKYKLSEDLLRAVIKVESNFNPNAVSKAGAMGLMQIIPKTCLELGLEKPFDIYENINAGSKYLRMMLDRYNNDVDLALAAYNAGPHNVDKYKGIPDFEETQGYVKSIKKLLLNL